MSINAISRIPFLEITVPIKNELNRRIRDLFSLKDAIKIELKAPGLKRREMVDVRELVKRHSLCCKNAIRDLKDRGLKEPFRSEIEQLKRLTRKFFKLELAIEEKRECLEARERLTGSTTLPEIPDFRHELKQIAQANPSLAEGCRHLKFVVGCCMRRKTGILNPTDLAKLRAFEAAVGNAHPSLKKLIQSQIQNLTHAIQRKLELLEDLSQALFIGENRSKPFDEWKDEHKMELWVRAGQILNNPFEPPLDLFAFLDGSEHRLLQILKKECAENFFQFKRTFWDLLPILERKAHALAKTADQKDFLCRCKTAGLQAIVAKTAKRKGGENLLIIGGGPSGLIHGIVSTFKGIPYQIIEKREKAKQNRVNVITLGKNDPKDVHLLSFLGIISRWDRDGKVSFGHMKTPLIEVQIKDVEEDLRKTLADLNGGNPHIRTNKRVYSIEKEEEGAVVAIADTKSSAAEWIKPSMIIVSDGFSGSTSKMLGIGKHVLAKTTQIAFSIFHRPSTPLSCFEHIKYCLWNGFQALILVIQVLFYALVHFTSFEEAYGAVVTGGPSAIFRIPAQDYVIRCLRKEEQSYINHTYRKKIAELKWKIEKKEGDPHLLTAKMNRLKAGLEEYLTERAQQVHGVLDIISAFVGENHQIQPMTVAKNFVADIVVSRAERSGTHVGKTPVLIRGDAAHTTDPYSGYGCKTALEEALADPFLFDPRSISSLEWACLAWGYNHYEKETIDRGLQERSCYRKDTELLQYYIDSLL